MAKYVLPLTGAALLLGVVAVACGTDAVPGVDPQTDGGSADAGKDTGTGPVGNVDAGTDAGGNPNPNAQSYAIGGKVVGLSGTGLVLQNNGGDDLTVNANNQFVFPTKIQVGKSFNVTVKTQPTAPSQVCTVSGATGTVVAANVTTVVVNCSTNTFTVGGTVSGLAGSGLVLQNNNGDDATIGADGSFAFATPINSGAPYSVTIKTQPSNLAQTCTLSNASGNVGSANVENVTVTCVTNKYTVGGNVVGLVGTGLVLQNENGDDLPVGSNGEFTFATSHDDGSAFAVSVKTQPGSPQQNCVVAGGTGNIAGGNVKSVVVNCANDKFVISGSISGLDGSGLVLQNNNGDDLPVNADGSFAFLTPLDDLAAYSVSVKTQPTNKWQTCTVSGGSGTVAAAPVSNVAISCTTNSYKVKGSVTGLDGSGLVLQNNGGNDLTIPGNGAFEFTLPVASGAGYLVTTLTNPSNKSQTCAVTSGNGTIAGADIENVSVACVTNKYTVGGTVTGLAGGNEVVLQNNGGDDLTVNADGSFTFNGPLESGQTFAVSVLTNPTSPNQTCVVTGDTGTVVAGNIVSVAVNCSTNTYTAGGTISGLEGTGLVLTNNGGSDLPVNSSSFAFPPQADGTAFDIAVKTQPTSKSQTCSVTNGSGNLAGANYTGASVTCVTNKFTVGGTVANLVGTVVLTNNGGDDKSISANGSFSFATTVASGGAYAVAVKTQPVGMTCAVTSGSGTVGNGNVTSVSVSCSTSNTSCLAIKLANSGAASGNYVIDVDGSGPKPAVPVYCDMTTDGGGYTYYKMTNGISTFKRTETNSCQALGLEIAVPRTAAHLSAMYAWAGSDMNFFQTLPGIYGTKSNVNYSNCSMNSNSNCASVQTDWKSIDGAPWFASSRTNITEPNGDYVTDCWLGNGGTIDGSGYTWFNDLNCIYETGANYICSDNAKKTSATFVKTIAGQDFYTVQVNGTMSDNNIRAACQAAGLTVPCQANGSCQYNDGLCKPNPAENSCGNPMLYLAQGLGCSNPATCPALSGVYQYMGNNWVSGSACGAEGAQWCSIGNNFSNKKGVCVAP